MEREPDDSIAAPTVMVIDDHDQARDALVRRLESLDGIVVVGAVGTAASALTLAARRLPEVIVFDARTQRADPVALVRSLVSLPRAPIVVVHTSFLSAAERTQLAEAGAIAFIPKDAGIRALLDCILTIRPRHEHG